MPEPYVEQPDSFAAACLALVHRSPALVAVHDRASWLRLFGTTGVVEDPVGTPPARAADGSLAAFWDTFIGPNEVSFEVHHDYQVGRAVFRDAIVHTRIAGALDIDAPAYLLYEVADDGRSVARMRAFWPLSSLSLTALKMGPSAWIEMTKLFARMVGTMGPRWVGGYLSALWTGIGARGPRVLEQLCAAIAAGDARAAATLFTHDARVVLAANERSASDLLALIPPGSALTITDAVNAGWSSAFRFSLSQRAGLGLTEFTPHGLISRLRLLPARE